MGQTVYSSGYKVYRSKWSLHKMRKKKEYLDVLIYILIILMEKEPIHAIVIITLSITWIHIMILDNHIFAISTYMTL